MEEHYFQMKPFPRSPAFSIYPNPAKNKITISFRLPLAEETDITIINLKGEQMVDERFRDQNQIRMDVGMLRKGIYLVKVQTGEGIKVKKLEIE